MCLIVLSLTVQNVTFQWFLLAIIFWDPYFYCHFSSNPVSFLHLWSPTPALHHTPAPILPSPQTLYIMLSFPSSPARLSLCHLMRSLLSSVLVFLSCGFSTLHYLQDLGFFICSSSDIFSLSQTAYLYTTACFPNEKTASWIISLLFCCAHVPVFQRCYSRLFFFRFICPDRPCPVIFPQKSAESPLQI